MHSLQKADNVSELVCNTTKKTFVNHFPGTAFSFSFSLVCDDTLTHLNLCWVANVGLFCAFSVCFVFSRVLFHSSCDCCHAVEESVIMGAAFWLTLGATMELRVGFCSTELCLCNVLLNAIHCQNKYYKASPWCNPMSAGMCANIQECCSVIILLSLCV